MDTKKTRSTNEGETEMRDETAGRKTAGAQT
ncbi:MAG TPA: IclR family transcriptional regulator, partial [Cupriavidus sp.]|nr:IclR family transcriptional regulator [Cupriavidus sp.]